MSHYARLAFTEPVRALQREHGSDRGYARHLERGAGQPDVMGEREQAFLATRDGFYLASVGVTGWPYVQYRGGPPGFVHVLDEHRFAFADVRGNRQYITTGNLTTDDRVAAFFMDYPRRARLKVFGRASIRRPAEDDGLTLGLCSVRTDGHVERLVIIAVEGLSWNCQQHITPRYSARELAPALSDLHTRLEQLQRDNAALRAQLASARGGS